MHAYVLFTLACPDSFRDDANLSGSDGYATISLEIVSIVPVYTTLIVPLYMHNHCALLQMLYSFKCCSNIFGFFFFNPFCAILSTSL